MRARLVAAVMLLAGLGVGLYSLAEAGEASRSPAQALAREQKSATGDWPWWRGPAWDGKSTDREVPIAWSATKNVIWKTAVPGRGHSSPIVCGDRVFLTTAEEQAQRQLVLAFDRKTGKSLWSYPACEGNLPRKNPKNSHASATPACDGTRLYSVFLNEDGLQAVATDLEGRVVWKRRVGTFQSEHGYGSSPVLYQSLLIVNGDSLKDSFLAALDAGSGEVVWRVVRPTTGRHGSYATPAVAYVAGKPQLILTGMGEVTSYDPHTGQRLWWCAGPAEVTACTPAWSDEMVFATGGFPEKEILAIRANGRGDVTQTHIAWRTGRGVAYVPSPLYHDGQLYVLGDGGIVTCYEAASGNQVWQERLAGAFTASPVLAGDRLFAASEAGKTFVLKAGPKFEVLATNDLGEGILATPAIAGGQVFLRTDKHLYCVGTQTQSKHD